MKNELRESVYKKLDGKCGYCGEDILFKDMQVDHIIPQNEYISHIKNKFRIPSFLTHLTESDKNHKDNLMPTCRVCNKWKSTFDLELFREELFEQINRLNKYNSNYRMAKKYSQLEERQKPIIFYFENNLRINS
jgi:5-methylcytosine-specific restriction endonuclease McrA